MCSWCASEIVFVSFSLGGSFKRSQGLWHFFSSSRSSVYVSFPWILADLWLLRSIEENRSDVVQAPRLGHKSPFCFCLSVLEHLFSECYHVSSISECSDHIVRSPNHTERPHVGSPANWPHRAHALSYPSPGTRQVSEEVMDGSSSQLFESPLIIWVSSAKVPDIVEQRQAIFFCPVWIPVNIIA